MQMHKNKLKQNQAYMRAKIYHSQMCSLPGQRALRNIERSPPTTCLFLKCQCPQIESMHLVPKPDSFKGRVIACASVVQKSNKASILLCYIVVCISPSQRVKN